ncbi:MAG: rane protein of unknown function, partial [Candidatus Saccharibacteria bacterium]|nr:rane protein of unknown function [Candidatus Saccharibacteria bacterium]
MSENLASKKAPRFKKPVKRRLDWRYVIGLPAWVFTSFIGANVIIVAGLILLKSTHIYTAVESDPVFNTVLAAVVYILTLAITIGLPWALRHRQTSLKDVGFQRLPSWMDILLAPAGAVVYL